jgi:Phytanoyl-CoA dioxygenase (PhyH)
MTDPEAGRAGGLGPTGRHFAEHGVAIIEYGLLPEDLRRMVAAFVPGDAAGPTAVAGVRHAAFDRALLGWLARHPALGQMVADLGFAGARLVRVVAFDKTPAVNWFVPWHQDRAIAVAARHEVEGYGPWTVKDGVLHVEPPLAVLEAMVTLRVHLDDCDEDNGPLETLLGSHRRGRLAAREIAALAEDLPRRLCLTAAGDVLALRPLTVHRSQRARLPRRRRVLHLEYCAHPLAPGLAWALDGAARA